MSKINSSHPKVLKVLYLLLLLSFFQSRAQVYQWANTIKSEGFDQAYDIVADPQGYVYVAGQIEFLADFGSGIVIESAGVHDIFIAKYTPEGRLVWAKGAGGKGGDKAHSIALDGLGNLFIGGEYEDTCYFDHIMKVTGVSEVNNMFVAKYDTAGNVQWVRNISIDGPLQTRGYSVGCDEQGNVYTCGGTKGDTYFENNFLFSSAGDYDATVFKFNGNGDYVWGRRMGGLESDKAYGILSDHNGFIYVTGYFVGLAEFAPGVSKTGNGGTDIFLAKFDTAGTLQWVEQVGDTGFERGWDITQNINGEILITGEFQGRPSFDGHVISSRGNSDMFLAAYDANGNNQWALSGGGPEDDIGRGIAHDTSGNIFVIGDYGGSATFPPFSISGNGFSEVFLTSYDQTGSTTRWVRSVGSYENDRGRGVACDNAGNIYSCGEYVDSAEFDYSTLHGDLLLDIFVTKLVAGNFCSTQITASGQITCHAACDGTAVANTTGLAPFTYSWSTSPVQTGSSISGLCAGTYTVTGTDAIGCSSTATITLSDPPATQLSTTKANASCFGLCDGNANAVAVGAGPFTFEWSTLPVSNGSTVNGLCAGTYTVMCTDDLGCTSTQSINISEPAEIQISVSKTDPSCFGDCTGIAIANVIGQSPLTYLWSDISGQTSSTAVGLCSGVYTVIVTDSSSCADSATISLVDPAQLQISTLGNDISCFGLCDGSALASANGNGPFTYSWSVSPPVSGASLSSLCAGTYTVTCTDVASCSVTSDVIIQEPLQILIASTVTNASCISCSDGSIDISVTGGTGLINFDWSNGTTNEDLLNVAAGTYTLCVSDDNSCLQCDTFMVLAPGTGVSTLAENDQISVYPNPFNSSLNFRLPNDTPGGTSLKLYNSIGELVYIQHIIGKEVRIESGNLSEGLYFIHIESMGAVIPVQLQK